MNDPVEPRPGCPDCGVLAGQPHNLNCSVLAKQIAGPKQLTDYDAGYMAYAKGMALPDPHGRQSVEWWTGYYAAMRSAEANTPALARQEGGGHYKGMKIQPFEYIHANGIGFAEGCVIKYVSRWRVKNGVEDLKKARHFLDLLIEAEANGGR